MAKNNINNTWTSEEDEILKKYYPIEGSEVVKRLPGRTKGNCMDHVEDLNINNNDTHLTEE